MTCDMIYICSVCDALSKNSSANRREAKYILFVAASGWWITPSVQCFIFDWIVRVIIPFRLRCVAIVRFVWILSCIVREMEGEKKEEYIKKSFIVKLFAFHVFRRGKWLLLTVVFYANGRKKNKMREQSLARKFSIFFRCYWVLLRRLW